MAEFSFLIEGIHCTLYILFSLLMLNQTWKCPKDVGFYDNFKSCKIKDLQGIWGLCPPPDPHQGPALNPKYC